METERTQMKLPVSSSNSPRTKKSPAMTKKGAFAAVSYMASAVLLIMFNKAALSSYNFPSANVITLFQMVSSCTFLYAMKCWKIVSFTTEPQSTPNNPAVLVPFKTLIRTLPLAMSYLLYMLVTMESVRGINVPMYTTLRRTTVAFTMIVEYILTRQKHSYPVMGSVGIIILGAIVAGARDLSFDAYSYGVVFVANICTAIYLASIAHIGKSSGLSTFGLMWCNGIICGPILLFWTSINGDLEGMINFPHLFSPGFQAVMLLSCVMAFSINYCVFWNTTLNSALTQTICGNLKTVKPVGFHVVVMVFPHVIPHLLYVQVGLHLYLIFRNNALESMTQMIQAGTATSCISWYILFCMPLSSPITADPIRAILGSFYCRTWLVTVRRASI